MWLFQLKYTSVMRGYQIDLEAIFRQDNKEDGDNVDAGPAHLPKKWELKPNKHYKLLEQGG